MSEVERLSSGRQLARSTIFSLGGQGATLLAAFIAIPLLVSQLGTARFGVLALAWVVIGYAQVFDLGIGRALAKTTSELIAEGRERELPTYFWTALAGMAALGLIAGAIVALLSPWIVGSVLNIPSSLEGETLTAFYLLSASLPLAISGAALRAHLEAHQRFDLVNAVVVPTALITYFGPLIALQISDKLSAVVLAVIASRVISWIANLLMDLRITPSLRRFGRSGRTQALRQLLGIGGWVTTTNVATALMQAADRFLVGALATITAVAYFATPYEVVTKLWLVSFAVAGVFFPAFALTLRGNPDRAAPIFGGAVRFGFLALFPITLGLVTFAHQGLELWLNADFAANSTHVLQLLAFGALISSLNQIALNLIQSARPALSAKLALIELPLYLGMFVVLLEAYGITGAALAWAIRAVLEGAVLLVLVRRITPAALSALRSLRWVPLPVLVAFGAASQLEGLGAEAVFYGLAMVAFVPLAWKFVLSSRERIALVGRLRRNQPAT